MSYAVCRMQKVKSAGLKGMQFHNQRERKSRTNDDIDHERTRENYDLKMIKILITTNVSKKLLNHKNRYKKNEERCCSCK